MPYSEESNLLIDVEVGLGGALDARVSIVMEVPPCDEEMRVGAEIGRTCPFLDEGLVK